MNECCHKTLLADAKVDSVQPSELIAECWVPMRGERADLDSIVWADEDCHALASGWEWRRARLSTAGVALPAAARERLSGGHIARPDDAGVKEGGNG